MNIFFINEIKKESFTLFSTDFFLSFALLPFVNEMLDEETATPAGHGGIST